MSTLENVLRGRDVEIVVSDPWELTGELGSPHLVARVTTVDVDREGHSGRLLVRFAEPIIWRDGSYEFFVASARHSSGRIEQLRIGLPVECNLIAISADRAASTEPLDTSWWRGGLAAIAVLQLMT